MLAFITAFLPLVIKLFPIIVTLFTRDAEERAKALEQFNQWVKQHQNDGLLSTSLRDQASAQKADLQKVAEARDAAPAVPVAPAAQPAPQAKSPVPSVPQAKT